MAKYSLTGGFGHEAAAKSEYNWYLYTTCQLPYFGFLTQSNSSFGPVMCDY